jgi:transposase
MSLRETLSVYWEKFQDELFPFAEGMLGPLSDFHKILMTVLDMIRLDAFLRVWHGAPGRPAAERAALARAFVAKAVFNFSTTRALIDRLQVDYRLRRLCGWARLSEVPSESTFSRAFAEFAESQLPSRLHEALIKNTFEGELVCHVSRDATAIEAREKPFYPEKVDAAPAEKPPKRKRGRPRKDAPPPPPKEPTRLERQQDMSLPQMLADLPQHCDVGTKRNAKGRKTSWVGYKLHVDTVEGDIPVSCILTSASVHDSQVALPLAAVTKQRLVNLYDLMDSAYDAAEIRDNSRSLGHVPIIAINPRRDAELKKELALEKKAKKCVNHPLPSDIRYNERSSAERVNANLKDNHGGRTLRVRGGGKVMCHLMFGIVVIAATQILRLVT